MKILSLISSAAKETFRKKVPDRQAHRRVEITVEREIVSVLVRGRQVVGAVKAEPGKPGSDPGLFQLPGPG